jgi:protein CpxP
MNKKHFSILVIIGLLLSNLMLIGFMTFQKKGKRPGPAHPKNIIIDRLSFDESQVSAYELLIESHLNKVQPKDREIRDTKNALYHQLQFDNNQATVDSLTSIISVIQKQIEQIHYDHFKDIKILCNPEQQKAYAKLLDDLSHIFSLKVPRGNRKNGPKNHR